MGTFVALALWLALSVPAPEVPKAPDAVGHFTRFASAVARKDTAGIASFVPRGAEFPIATGAGGKTSRKTYDREAVLAGVVPFPPCDPAQDALACEAPRPSGRVICTCLAPAHRVEVELMLPSAAMPDLEVQLLSIRDTPL